MEMVTRKDKNWDHIFLLFELLQILRSHSARAAVFVSYRRLPLFVDMVVFSSMLCSNVGKTTLELSICV